MTYDQITRQESARALIREFIRRWGARDGVQRAAIALNSTVTEVNKARRFF